MFELTGPTGEKLFETYTISLVCAACMETDEPEKCTHRLHLLPRWLSSAKMETVKALLADDPAMLVRSQPCFRKLMCMHEFPLCSRTPF